MKSCPKCNRRYSNNDLHYCTQDGEPLLTPHGAQDASTLRFGSSLNKYSAVKKIIVLILVGIAALAAILFQQPDVMFQSRLQPKPTPQITPTPDVRRSIDAGEPATLIDKAVLTLDLTKHWAELDEKQRKESPASKGTLHADIVLRKLSDDAKYGRRVGTTSRFKPEWDSSTHSIGAQEDGRKCSPEVQHSFMLYFDIEKEGIDIPFNLSYDIHYWNAHNGLKGDWQAVYVGHPTKLLIIEVKFPKDKPYTKFYLKSGDGIDCNAKRELVNNPTFQESVEEKTGAKIIRWIIESPQLHWTYRIDWDWS